MSLKSLQEKIGVTADGVFGPNTMKKAMEFYKLTPIRAAHFFAQTSHETGGFKAFSENLNYSAQGLQKIFRKYFSGNLEQFYARNPEKIANTPEKCFIYNDDVTSTKIPEYLDKNYYVEMAENRLNDFLNGKGVSKVKNEIKGVANEIKNAIENYLFSK